MSIVEEYTVHYKIQNSYHEQRNEGGSVEMRAYKTTELWQTAGKWLPTGVSRHPEGPQAFECKMDNIKAEN